MAADAHRAAGRAQPPRRAGVWRWRGPVAGLVTILVVAVPAMAVAEDWHGRPMIDEAGHWWVLPGAIALVAFFAGGAVAARRPDAASYPRGALLRRAAGAGVLLGAVAAAILVVADGVRRLLVNPTLPSGVVRYWIEAAAVAVVVCTLGALASAAAARRPGAPRRRRGGSGATGP